MRLFACGSVRSNKLMSGGNGNDGNSSDGEDNFSTACTGATDKSIAMVYTAAKIRKSFMENTSAI